MDSDQAMKMPVEQEGIKQLLPHRSPFLFVDRIISSSNEEIVGEKCFGEDEFFFQGHFPEYPVVPGVLLVESMAQCGGAGLGASGKIRDALFFLAKVENAKFRRQVRPGETVRFVIENKRVSGMMIRQAGKAFVGEELAAEAQWLCIMQPKEKEV